MRNIVNPRRRLSAPQVVAYLQGTKYIAFVAVGPEGEPHVSPLDAVFIHGRFTMSTSARADKVRHLRANPKCSAVHMDGDRIAMVASGTVRWKPEGEDQLREHHQADVRHQDSSPARDSQMVQTYDCWIEDEGQSQADEKGWQRAARRPQDPGQEGERRQREDRKSVSSESTKQLGHGSQILSVGITLDGVRT
jgi:hypothetical protein